MASLANIQDAINKEKSQAGQPEDRPPIATTTNAPEMERSESAHPPGAWVDDDVSQRGVGNDEPHSSGIGESIMGALGMAGSTAAQYLPTGLMNSVVGYAPGVSGPSKPATDISNTVDAASTPAAPAHESGSGITTGVTGALGAGGSTAAQYLPASLVNSVVGYAPGVSGPSKPPTGSTTTDISNSTDATSNPAPGSTTGVMGALGSAGSTAAQYLPTSLVNSVAGRAPGVSGPSKPPSGGMTDNSNTVGTTSNPASASESASGITTGVTGALGAAGSTAAQYLPASLVNSVVGYAPGVSGPAKPTSGTPDVNGSVGTTSNPAPHHESVSGSTTGVTGALGSVGSTAAQYLPASLVNSVAGYAPGVSASTKPTSGGSTDVSNAFDATSTSAAPAPGSQSHFGGSKDDFVFKSSQADLNAPVNVNKDLGWQAPTPTRSGTQDSFPEMSINKDSGSEVLSRRSTQESTVPTSEKAGIDTAAQFIDPDVLTPLSPQSLRSVAHVGGGRPGATVSTTAVNGHSSTRSGIEPPPPSAATLISPTSQGPLSSKMPIGTPTPLAGLDVDKNDRNTAPSSVVSVKSGVVGSGPTDELGSTPTGSYTNPNADKSLPPTPAGRPAVQDGVTPRGSELEEDLQYLAPHIRQQNSAAAVPTTMATPADKRSVEKGNIDTGASRFDEGVLDSAHLTPTSDISDSHSHESNVSEGGTRRVSLIKRIRGEAKVIAGKIKHDEGKVAEGKAMLHGDV